MMSDAVRIPLGLTRDALMAAHERIAAYVHRTPVLTCHSIDEWTGAQLHFKCENFQKMGAFKMRGALNALLQLPKEKLVNGVATHSSGNFAQALALSARLLGVKAYIVMPSNSPSVKKAAVRGYGGQIIECEPTLQARESTLEQVIAQSGATFVHPFNDENVVLGQGTAAKELIEDAGPFDYLVAPVGGGGLRTSLGDKTFPVLYLHTEAIVRVSEAAIVEALRYLMERMKVIVEPSSAVALAAIKTESERFRGKKVGVILSGGNLDLSLLADWLK